MKRVVLLLFTLLAANCAHRSPAVQPQQFPPFLRTASNVTAPSVDSEPPSPSLVVAPVVVGSMQPAEREAAGRFLQRVAYHTRVRESLTKAPVPSVAESPRLAPLPLTAPQPLPAPHAHLTPVEKKTFDIATFMLCCVAILGGIAYEATHR